MLSDVMTDVPVNGLQRQVDSVKYKYYEAMDNVKVYLVWSATYR